MTKHKIQTHKTNNYTQSETDPVNQSITQFISYLERLPYRTATKSTLICFYSMVRV